jgi:hypothetical protein
LTSPAIKRVLRAALSRTALVLGVTACASAGAGATSVTIEPALMAEARARGSVRSIVEIRVPAGATEAEIATVKRRVLAHVGRTRHEVVRELPGFPLLVLDASEATLQALIVSPDVLRVSADAVHRPQR